jgi:hypothetical protein
VLGLRWYHSERTVRRADCSMSRSTPSSVLSRFRVACCEPFCLFEFWHPRLRHRQVLRPRRQARCLCYHLGSYCECLSLFNWHVRLRHGHRTLLLFVDRHVAFKGGYPLDSCTSQIPYRDTIALKTSPPIEIPDPSALERGEAHTELPIRNHHGRFQESFCFRRHSLRKSESPV